MQRCKRHSRCFTGAFTLCSRRHRYKVSMHLFLFQSCVWVCVWVYLQCVCVLLRLHVRRHCLLLFWLFPSPALCCRSILFAFRSLSLFEPTSLSSSSAASSALPFPPLHVRSFVVGRSLFACSLPLHFGASLSGVWTFFVLVAVVAAAVCAIFVLQTSGLCPAIPLSPLHTHSPTVCVCIGIWLHLKFVSLYFANKINSTASSKVQVKIADAVSHWIYEVAVAKCCHPFPLSFPAFSHSSNVCVLTACMMYVCLSPSCVWSLLMSWGVAQAQLRINVKWAHISLRAWYGASTCNVRWQWKELVAAIRIWLLVHSENI